MYKSVHSKCLSYLQLDTLYYCSHTVCIAKSICTLHSKYVYFTENSTPFGGMSFAGLCAFRNLVRHTKFSTDSTRLNEQF